MEVDLLDVDGWIPGRPKVLNFISRNLLMYLYVLHIGVLLVPDRDAADTSRY